MANRITRFFIGDEGGWADLFFRVPPKHPDARDIFLGGAGLITGVRGALYLVSQPPQGELFKILGPVFVGVWSWIWIIGGFGVLAVAVTGHRWPEVDRVAGFGLMMIWWIWGGIYLLSGIFWSVGDRRDIDLVQGAFLVLTGIVLSAGVIQGIRKTQEIQLRKLAMQRLREQDRNLAILIGENDKLREEKTELEARLRGAD